MNNLFQYSDYRSFLQAHHALKKQENPHWTYGLWAKRLGLKDNSGLIKIVNGKREAGPLLCQKLIHYFKFNLKEASYFQDLVKISKYKNNPEVIPILMRKLKQDYPQLEFSLLDEEEFSIISHWIYYALRQMTKLPDFELRAEWVAKQLQFPLSLGKIKRALELLVEKGYLVQDPETQKWKVAGKSFNTRYDFASEAIKQFHEGSLDNANKAIRQVSVENREYLSATLAFPRSQMKEAKAYLRQVVQEFNNMFDESSADSVYQLQINFYPITKTRKIKEKL